MKKNNGNKVVLAIIAVALAIVVVGGSTFAYWIWQTSTEQQTAVNVTVAQGIKMTINPTSTLKTGLHPTNDCDSDAALVSTATIIIENQTGILARPSFKLKAKIDKNIAAASEALGADDVKFINYAVFEGTATECDLTKALHYGTLEGVATNGTWTDLPGKVGQFASTTTTNGNEYEKRFGDDLINHSGEGTVTDDTDGFLDNTTFDAIPYKDDNTHEYKVYVWLDPDYVHTNTGTEVGDPMQNAIVTVTWSENSKVEQLQ